MRGWGALRDEERAWRDGDGRLRASFIGVSAAPVAWASLYPRAVVVNVAQQQSGAADPLTCIIQKSSQMRNPHHPM